MIHLLERTGLVAWITVVWVLLWGEATAGNILGGALVGVFLTTLFPPDPGIELRFRPLHALRYVTWFIGALVKASLTVAWAVVNPRSRIAEGIVSVPVQGANDVLLTIVGNSISLTPGTLTINIDRTDDGAVLYVHCLQLTDPDAVRQEVQHMEYLAVRAFGPAEVLTDLEARRRRQAEAAP